MIIAAVVILQIGIAVLMLKCFKIAKAGQAIVRTGAGGTCVSFDRVVVIPRLHDYELVDITSKKLTFERVGDWALKFKCGTRAELEADLIVRVNKDAEDVKRALQFLGGERLNSPELLKTQFRSMFNDSLETLAGKYDFDYFSANKDKFREEFLQHIGSDLSGMVLEDICLHHLREA